MKMGKRIKSAIGRVARRKMLLNPPEEGSVNGVCLADQERGMAVSRRRYARLGGDIAAGTSPVLDDDWLGKALRQPLSDEARGDIGTAPGRKSDNQPHRPCWIVLRARDPRECRRQGGSPGET